MKKPLLKFTEQGKDHRGESIYYVYNHKNEFLGVINKSRVGKFMHYIFCPQEQTFYTNGCLKEIVEFITNLYSNKKKVIDELKGGKYKNDRRKEEEKSPTLP